MADEVGELVVRLTGDGTGYQKTMENADKSLRDLEKRMDQGVKGIEKNLDNLEKSMDRTDAAMERRGQQLVESLFPREKFETRMTELQTLFQKGIISQDVVNRGTEKYLKDLFKDDLKRVEDNLRHNEREQDKINRYRDSILKHNNREQEKIETYNRREQEKLYSQQLRDKERLLTRARAISEAADPSLAINRRISEVNRLSSLGMISKTVRDASISKLKGELERAGDATKYLNGHLGQSLTVLRSIGSAAGVGGLGGLNAAFGRLGVVAAAAYVTVKGVKIVIEEMFYGINKQLERTRDVSERMIDRLASGRSTFSEQGSSAPKTRASMQEELKSATRWADVYAGALAKSNQELDRADTFLARNVTFSKEAYRLRFAQQEAADYKKLSLAREENLQKMQLELKLMEDAKSRQMTTDTLERSAKLIEDTNTAGEKYVQTLKEIKELENKVALDVGEQGMNKRQVEAFKRLRKRAVEDFQKEAGFDKFFGNISKSLHRAIEEVEKNRAKLKEKGQRIREDLFPEEAYNAKVRELNELFKGKFISGPERDLGIKKAQDELDDFYRQTQKDYTINFGFKSRGAVESGTQEAQAQIEQYTDAIKQMYKDAENAPKLKINPIIPQVFQAPQLNAGGAGGAAAAQQAGGAQQMTGLLQQLVNIAQQQLDKAGITLSPTSFNE